jgi:ATP-dependent helicase/nuclease subunit B
MTELKARGERPGLERHGGRIEALALEAVARWKEEVPPATALAAEHETRDLLESLRVFLKDEEAHCRRVEPAFFELAFGIPGEGGLEEPVRLSLPEAGVFRLRGRIDRVDRVREGEYEIWDYKGGRARVHQDPKAYRQGRVLQHVLYALAAEEILKQEVGAGVRVVRSGYFFPSPRGDGERIARGPEDREQADRALGALFALLREGVFPARYDKGSCWSCDYGAVCGGEEAVSRTQARLERDGRLEPLRRLKHGG